MYVVITDDLGFVYGTFPSGKAAHAYGDAHFPGAYKVRLITPPST